MTVRIAVTRDAEQFDSRARDFLHERVQRNVLATVLADVRDGAPGAAGALYAFALDARGRVVATALRTPPWPMLASGFDARALAVRLLDGWLPLDPLPTGISGEPACARAVASAWTVRTGGSSRLRMSNAIHTLTEVQSPAQPAAGALRLARPSERDLLVGWEEAFAAEAGVPVSGQDEAMVDARLARGAHLVWDDHGPVCALGIAREIAGTVRIGPVYTPPEHRRCGYATSAVAAAAQRSLDCGAIRCTLFTDLANPTANRIYASVGFRRVAAWEEHELHPGAAGRGRGARSKRVR